MSERFPGGIVTNNPATPTGPFENGAAPGIWTVDQATNFIRQGVWPTAGNIAPDPFFENVTMLLHGDGTNGGQNNTFLDSSTNNFTITRNGNTTQGSFSPYGPNWSNYFDGASDYFNLGYRSALELTSQNFTIEFWLNQSTTAVGMICGTWRTNSSSYVWGVFSSGGGLGFSYSTTGSYQGANDGKVGTSVSIGVWMHIAIVRNGTTLTLYKDGVAVSTNTSMTDPVASGQQFWIGGNSGDSQWLNGNISNLRITNTVVYTANFTPSTTPLTAISGTQLLTCQNNRFVDNSTNNFALTVVGTPRVQRFSPFAPASPGYTTATIGGSGYFDGAGDYLQVSGGTPLTFGTGNFTIEGWVYPTTAATQGVFQVSSTGLSTAFSTTIAVFVESSGWSIYTGSGVVYSTVVPTFNAWNHFAYVRNSGTITLYINGVSVISTVDGTNYTFSTMAIGGAYDTTFLLTGYISNLRVVKGTAVYTTNFTPPTAPVTAITNTSLLTNFTNAAIFDNAMMNNLETVGNAQISTSVVKFGTGSMAFDGSGDWLQAPASPVNGLGSGDFTVEMWVYMNNTTGTQVFYDNTVLGNGPALYSDGGSLRWYDGTVRNSGGTISAGVWTHIAVTRASTNLRFFINGVQTPTGFLIGTNYGNNVAVRIGSSFYGENFNGYIDDLRVTVGVARYTATFTPPTAAFPNI
jgi:hypothetical protein